jgi:hypothetical protein
MNKEFSKALEVREAAAADLMAAAHSLGLAIAAFTTSDAAVLALIPGIAAAVGDRAQARHAAGWHGEPSSSDAETNGRIHASSRAGQGAAASIEHGLCQAYSNGLRSGSAAETLGCELSTEAGAFLRAAADVAAQRAPLTQPDGQFLKIISAQCNRLRELTKEFSR